MLCHAAPHHASPRPAAPPRRARAPVRPQRIARHARGFSAPARARASPELGDTAVVIGASVAGLLSAAALSPHFRRVLVLDRDAALPGLGATPAAPRRGVPQSAQPHVLFARGLAEMEALLPGVTAQLVRDDGALRVDWASDFACFAGDAWWARAAGPGDVASLTCSRYVLESAARRRLAAQARNVEFRAGARVAGLLRAEPRDGDAPAVTGVALAGGGALAAELTVDAAGRGSACAAWLAQAGLPAQAGAKCVDAGLRYATRVFRRAPDAPALPFKVMVISADPRAEPAQRRIAYIGCLEGDRLVATLGGYGAADAPPLPAAEWDAFAATLPGGGAFARALEAAEPEAGYRDAAVAHAVTANVWRSFPPLRGLCHVGDSAVALCPAYGQGMTVAALGAAQLRHAVARAAADVAAGRAEQRAAVHAVSAAMATPPPETHAAWDLAVGQDAAFPGAVVAGGASAAQPPALTWYLRALRRHAAMDASASHALLRVSHLLDAPAALLAPRLAGAVLAAEARNAVLRRR